jgi:methyltransferase-like protein
MAFGIPRSEFVGIDLAAKPVEIAQKTIFRLGLKNIRIEELDLMEIEACFGQFDYIIAHGIYAWVPEPVQEKILAICSANLSPNGVAFVSYNTNPAGYVRQILRAMMRFHEQHGPETAERVNSSKGFLESILGATDANFPWKALFQDELKVMFNRDPNVVFHDDLAQCFLPVSFGDFIERVTHSGLQVLSEAHLSDLLEPDVRVEALAALRQFANGDPIAYQQYLDFARYRRFRQTLLCHAKVSLRRDHALEGIKKMLVPSPMKVSAQQAGGAVEFANSRGAGTLKTNDPSIVAVLRRLETIWPQAERFGDLVNAVLASLPAALQSKAIESLAQSLLKLTASQLADLRTYCVPFPDGVSEKPTASLLARTMVDEGSLVTTLLRTQLNIEDEEGRKFLQLLDGTRDRQELADALVTGSPRISRETILAQVDGNLINFYRMGLLIA